jgi:octaprenyl-diphosphate synthase
VTADLAQIFEPIREDLEKVEQEFARHIESRVALIPEMGQVHPEERRQARAPGRAVDGGAARRLHRRSRRAQRLGRRVHPHRDARARRHHRRRRRPPRPLAVHSRWGNDITVLLGDYLYIKSMAMALTQDSLEIVRLLCDVTLRMIEGELYQLTKTGDVDITRTSTSRSSAARPPTCSAAARRSARCSAR